MDTRVSHAIPIAIVLTLATAAGAARPPRPLVHAPRQDGAVTERHYPKAKAQANELGMAVVMGDFARAADLTYPKLIEFLGGRARYIAQLKKQMTEMSAGEFKLLSCTAAEPIQVIEVRQRLYAVIPSLIRIKGTEGVLVGQAFMIGVSKDGGETWTFVDSGGREMKREKLK